MQHRSEKPRHRNRGTIVHKDKRTKRARTRADQLREELEEQELDDDVYRRLR